MEKFGVNRSEDFKVLLYVQEIHRPDRQKATEYSRSVEQLTDVHLATSARSICVFWIDGIQQLTVYFPHADTYISQSCPTSNDGSGKVR